MLSYNGLTSLSNASLQLSVLDNVGLPDPSRTFVIPQLLPYTMAGSMVRNTKTSLRCSDVKFQGLEKSVNKGSLIK